MAFGALRRMLPTALHKVDHLVALDLINNVSLHSRAFNHRRAHSGTHHKHFIKLNFFTSISSELFNAEDITRLYPILLAAGFEDRKHGHFLFIFALYGPDISAFLAFAASNCAPHFGTCHIRKTGHPAEARLIVRSTGQVKPYGWGVAWFGFCTFCMAVLRGRFTFLRGWRTVSIGELFRRTVPDNR